MFATEGAASGRVAAPRYDVLVVSAGGAEAQRIATKLERRCPGVFAVTACTPVEAEARLAGTRPACIVLSLPDDHDPLLRLRQLLGTRPDTPVVVIGADDAGLATMLLHEGAQDHLPRSGLDGRVLARSLRAAIERSAGELALVHEVLHDHLTGLPNRRLLMDRLGVALRHAARLRLSIPVVFVDLDGFKAINDRLGHDAGDRLLVEVARRLAASVRSADTVARFGGDEFVVLSPDHTPPEESERLAHRVADAVCEVSYCDGDVILD